MNKQMTQLIDSMVNHGVPRVQAIALALSIEHSIKNDDFALQYGTFMVRALKEFMETVNNK